MTAAFDPNVPPADDPLTDPAELELQERLAEARVLIDGIRPATEVNIERFLEDDALEAAALLREHDRPYFWRLTEELRPFKVLRQWQGALGSVAKALAHGEQKVAEKARLIKIADDLLSLWHDGSDAWCAAKERGPGCCWRMPSGEAKRFLLLAYGERNQITIGGDGRRVPTAPSRQAAAEALDQLEAIAYGTERGPRPGLRVAGDGRRLVLDLCRDDYLVVEVTPDGWRMIKPSPLHMRRAAGMRPLPLPISGGNAWSELRDRLGLADREHARLWALVVGFSFACLRPGPGYPVMVVGGEQGSGKTTLMQAIRAPIDPHEVAVQPKPRYEEDLFINCETQHILGYDNLSVLSQEWSDAFCRIATGSGYSKRKLYTDRDVTQFCVSRPQIITSIADVAASADLLDRSFLIELPGLDGDRRRGEIEVMSEVTALVPRLLGQLLDAAVVALRGQAAVELSEMPRMVDVARWVEAGAGVLGHAPEQFLDSYLESAERAGEMALEASLLGGPIRDLLNLVDDGVFCGEAGLLLRSLNDFMRNLGRATPRGWPQTARAMSGQVRRIAPALRRIGYEVAFTREPHTGRRLIMIEAPPRPYRSAENFAGHRHHRHHRHPGPGGAQGAGVVGDGGDGGDGASQHPDGQGHKTRANGPSCDQPGCGHQACAFGSTGNWCADHLEPCQRSSQGT
jgi:hypothetical protein